MALVSRVLSDEEISAKFPKRGQMNLDEYTALLDPLAPGDGVSVEMNGLTDRQLKRRLTTAAKQVLPECKLRYQVDGNQLLFLVRARQSSPAR